VSGHTPGPWSVKSKTERQSVGAGVTNVTVAWCGEASSSGEVGSYFVDRDECEANACLIAASPDMLAALKAFVAKIDPVCMIERDHPQVDLADEYREALEVIAKAEARND